MFEILAGILLPNLLAAELMAGMGETGFPPICTRLVVTPETRGGGGWRGAVSVRVYGS